jgi:serine/threonine protein kinase
MCPEKNLPARIGRYEIRDELGRGGMATVFLANDPHFKRDVAIKVLPAAFTHDPTFRARFEREAQIIAALEYPGIVPVYDYGEENGQPYLVMRYMPGGSLSERLKGGPLSLIEASRIFTRLGTALDMKPANILFDGYSNAYLSDFGIARITQANIGLTGDGLIGTPAYMSPEQARGDVDIDGRSDVYALGAILFEMLTGKQPYEATTPMGVAMKHITDPIPRLLSLNTELPPDCQDLIDKAMAKDRDQRFQTAASMAIAIAVLAVKTR